MKTGTKIIANANADGEKFFNLIEEIKSFLPDHVIVEIENCLIINSNRIDDLQIIERMAKAAGLAYSDYSLIPVSLDALGKTPEFWAENAKLAKVAQAATAMAEAAKANGVTVDDIAALVISMAKKK